MKFKRALRWLGMLLATLFGLLLIAAMVLFWSLRASLAQLDGRRGLPGLQGRVIVDRDALGVPTLYASNRYDVTRALGFLHAQDRFFQMDLARRAGGGELSELFGPMALERDQEQRIHRPRACAKRAFQEATPQEQTLLLAYTEGVNAGLDALTVRPPEYLALRASPAHWRPEDTYFVAYAMFGELHDTSGYEDHHQMVLRKAFSPAALAFFNSPDIAWSAALDGSTVPAPRIPTPEEFCVTGTNQQASVDNPFPSGLAQETSAEKDAPRRHGKIGSNNWAVDGHHTTSGAAIVANDMHLGLHVPNTWYRARLVYQQPEQQDVIGVTLPGTPVVVSGSNRHVAWGNTASCLDITDLVSLEFDLSNPHRYRTPSGWRELEQVTETILVRNGTNVTLPIEMTIWGPVVTRSGTKYALACTMHEPQAVNMGLIQIEQARDSETVLRLANLSGAPVNNFVVGDVAGNIGYSLLGRLPNRSGFDGATACSWVEARNGWQGWVPTEKYPRLLNPANGVLWTANNRTLGSAEYNGLHICSPDNGARAHQIRDVLLRTSKPSEQTLWSIYHDDRALFLERWQKLMTSVLEKGSATNAAWQEAKGYVLSWGGRAAVDSQGYRLVRGFRAFALNLLCEPVNQHLAKYDKLMRIYPEDAAWAMLEARPPHLLNPKFTSYDRLLEKAVDLLLADLKRQGIPLSHATWGSRNRLQIQHPLSLAVPRLSPWLDMPDAAVSGDEHMPKVHEPGVGISERMVVSPGHEEDGLYNMPCGQSGHFLSPFYRSEMEAWLKVQRQPFLPGSRKHQLELFPSGGIWKQTAQADHQ